MERGKKNFVEKHTFSRVIATLKLLSLFHKILYPYLVLLIPSIIDPTRLPRAVCCRVGISLCPQAAHGLRA